MSTTESSYKIRCANNLNYGRVKGYLCSSADFRGTLKFPTLCKQWSTLKPLFGCPPLSENKCPWDVAEPAKSSQITSSGSWLLFLPFLIPGMLWFLGSLLLPPHCFGPLPNTTQSFPLTQLECFPTTIALQQLWISTASPSASSYLHQHPFPPAWAVSEQALCLLGKHKLKVFGRAFCQHYQCRVPSCNLQLPSLIIHSNICWWNIIHTGRPAVSCGCLPLFYIHDCTVKLITLHVSIHPQW